MTVSLPSRKNTIFWLLQISRILRIPQVTDKKNKKNKFVSQNLSNGLSGTLEISTDKCISGYGIYFQRTSHLFQHAWNYITCVWSRIITKKIRKIILLGSSFGANWWHPSCGKCHFFLHFLFFLTFSIPWYRLRAHNCTEQCHTWFCTLAKRVIIFPNNSRPSLTTSHFLLPSQANVVDTAIHDIRALEKIY